MTTPKRKPPAFQFYPDSWLSSADIMMMTPAQEGAYIRLLAIAWLSDDCGLPDDDEALAVLSRLGKEWGNGCSTIVRRKFNERGGRLFNERLLAERKKQEDRSKKCAASGVASGRARNIKQLGPERSLNERTQFVERKGNSSSPSSSPSPSPKKKIKDLFISTSFNERFWPAYPKKKAKPAALRAWKALKPSEDTILAILKDLPRWNDTEKQFIPFPATYLNQRRWEDEEKEEDRWAFLKEEEEENGKQDLQ